MHFHNSRSLFWFSAVALIASGCDHQQKTAFMSTSQKVTASGVYTKTDGDATAIKATPTPSIAPTAKADISYSENPVSAQTDSVTGDFSTSIPVDVTVSGGAVWAVTGNIDGSVGSGVSRVYRIELDASRNYPMQSWDIPFEWGNRTYVSEIGLVIGRTQRGSRVFNGKTVGDVGGIYVAGPAIAGGVAPIFTKADANPWMAVDSRMCVTSYVAGGKPYIGGAYVATDYHRKFVRIPLDKTQPNGFDASKKEVFDMGAADAWWGYSCFVDQKHNSFWSDHGNTGAARNGVDLNTNKLLTASSIPNADHVFDNTIVSLAPKTRASYAMAGDANGNILSFPNVYTATHESTLDLVYISNGWNVHVAQAACFSTRSDCDANSGRFFSWDLSKLKNPDGSAFNLYFGAMSSLNDGRVVAVTPRDFGASQLFLMSPKDPNDLSKGPLLKKIGQLNDPAYMYTDFTGATLYAAHVEKSVSLADAAGFKPGVNIVQANFTWTANSGQPEAWNGLKLQLRCFDNASSSRPDWVNFQPGKAGELTLLPCSGKFNTVEFQIDGTGTSAFSRTKSFAVTGHQTQG